MADEFTKNHADPVSRNCVYRFTDLVRQMLPAGLGVDCTVATSGKDRALVSISIHADRVSEDIKAQLPREILRWLHELRRCWRRMTPRARTSETQGLERRNRAITEEFLALRRTGRSAGKIWGQLGGQYFLAKERIRDIVSQTKPTLILEESARLRQSGVGVEDQVSTLSERFCCKPTKVRQLLVRSKK